MKTKRVTVDAYQTWQGLFRYALRSGKLQKQPCWVCGEPKSEGHHAHYDLPLDVVWLCRKHHREAHRAAA